jgi:succinate dehydrogenase / fumarate reductase membrane anchor subunit
MSLETPLHKTQGLGSSHSGLSHFVNQRVSAIALFPLTIWFAVSALGLVGASEVSTLIFLSNPVNAVLMGAFVVLSLYHWELGLSSSFIDYVAHEGAKLFLTLLGRVFAVAVAAVCIFALLRIAL